MEAPKFNLRSPAVKRILQEIKEIKTDPSGDFLAEALEENIFEWHFVLRGSPDTEFRGGIYHGRILLPAEYPFKPPSFTMLTPNGRFETNTKICLSISSHHPEHWQPSWSVRTALTALTAFMPSAGHGAIGSLDYNKEERQALAQKSRLAPPAFGSPERRQISAELHQQMLKLHPQDADPAVNKLEASGEPEVITASPAHSASHAASHIPHTLPHVEPTGCTAPQSGANSGQTNDGLVVSLAGARQPAGAVSDPALTRDRFSAPGVSGQLGSASRPHAGIQPVNARLHGPGHWEDRGLTLLAMVLVVLIAALVFRKLFVFSGWDVQALLSHQ